MLAMVFPPSKNSSMNDVRKLIDLFNSYNTQVANVTPSSKLKVTRRRSARISDVSRNSSEGDWTDPRLWTPDPEAEQTPPRPSTSREHEYNYDFSSTPRSSIDRSSTIRASLIKSIVATRTKETTRPHTAHFSSG